VTANLDPSDSARCRTAAPAQSAAAGAASERSVISPDGTVPSVTPPPELGEKIAAAAHAWAALAATNRYVVFSETVEGRIAVELQDEDGLQLETLNLTGLFDLIEDEGGG
jgi:hypothetical protein